MEEVDHHLLTAKVHKMSKKEASNGMCTLVRYTEVRNTKYKNEEIVFAKKVQSESFADVLKGGHQKSKLDIDNILTEMNSRIQIQQENTLKKELAASISFSTMHMTK